jgi:hypothetical protein
MDDEVVIIGDDGTEHVFPAGFDPQKAAAIVRGGGAEAPQQAAPPQQEQPLSIGQWAARAIGGAFLGPAGVEAANNPGATLASAAMGGAFSGLRAAKPFIGPVMGRAAGAVADVLERPTVSGGLGAAMGAYEGGKHGGVSGALTGALIGAGSGVAGSGALRKIHKKLTPAVMVPGSRLVKGAPKPPTLEQELTGAVNALRQPKTPGIVAQSHPQGGGFTTPPDVPIPTDKSFRRIAPFAKNARARYRELSQKTIVTPQEARELAQLKEIVDRQAQEVGTSYAAGGK